MEMEKIPIPRAQLWREIRLRALPLVVFLLTSVVVARLWSERVNQANMTGVVIGLQAEIRSPASGYLAQVGVERFREVAEGEVIGQVITTDPRLLEARLAVVLAEVELLRFGVGPAADHQRALLNQEAMEIDLMRSRIALASAQLRRQQAARELQRVEELRGRGLAAEEVYERARSDLEILVLETEEQTAMIDEIRRRLEVLGNGGTRQNPDGPVAAAIRRQEEELRLIETEAMPAALISPIAGLVSRVHRANGERVTAEEPVLILRSRQPEYIVGYLPQPLRMQPEIGMPVVIRSRSNARQEYLGHVIGVGAQIEDMTEIELLAAPQTTRTGLPVMIAFDGPPPPLRPGELVQLTLRSR